MKALLIVEYDDEYDIDDLMVDYTLFHQEKKVYKMFNEILIPIPKKKYAIQGMKGYSSTVKECKGYNACIDEILRGTE